MKLWRWTLVCSLGAVICGTQIAPAAAQPSTDQIYEDAKDIIETLIEREVATTVAPNLACYSPHGLLKYFPRTLQAIYERNFGSIKEVMRREVIALAANYAYRCFDERRSIALGEFLPAAAFEASDETTACVKKIVELGGPQIWQEQLGQSKPIDACTSQAPMSAGREVACLFAQSVGASAQDRAAPAQELIAQAIAVTVADRLVAASLPSAVSAEHLAALRITVGAEIRTLLSTGTFDPVGIFAAFSSDTIDQSLTMAKAQSLAAILKESAPRTRQQAAALRLLISGSAGGASDWPDASFVDAKLALVPFLEDLDAVSVVPGEGLGTAIARALVLRAGKVPEGLIRVSVDAQAGIALAFEKREGIAVFTGEGLARLEELHRIAQVSTDLKRRITSWTRESANLEPALRTSIAVSQLLVSLLGELRNLSSTQDSGFDVLAVLDQVARSKLADKLCTTDGGAAAAAADQTPDACDVWKQAAVLVDPQGPLRRLLMAAREKDYRGLAVQSVAAVFSRTAIEKQCAGQSEDCAPTMTLYGQFAQSFASYVLMPKDDQDAALAARAAFKATAVDVIHSIGKRDGLDRTFWSAFIVPTASLRLSWNSAYMQGDGDGLRTLATIDWPTIRFPEKGDSSMAYFGGMLSFTDPLAPLAELVTRDPDSDYEDELGLLAMMVQPRASVFVAIPSLSNNLALTLGASLRGAAPVTTGRMSEGRAIYEYVTLFEGKEIDKLMEVSAGLQYIP